MTPTFVRYSPAVEQNEPNLDQTLQQALDDRGGEYFFMPSLSALTWSGNLAETSSIEQKER